MGQCCIKHTKMVLNIYRCIVINTYFPKPKPNNFFTLHGTQYTLKSEGAHNFLFMTSTFLHSKRTDIGLPVSCFQMDLK